MYEFAALIIVLLIVFIYFCSLNAPSQQILLTSAKNNKSEYINKLMRQALRYFVASKQDNNPVIKMLHSNYAVGYIESLGLISTQMEIFHITGVDIKKLGDEATQEQDKALMELVKVCPNILSGMNSSIYQSFVKKLA
jgi:hypothetical protein